ncbi:unnamed protein product [Dibothriocephalus latus]|uniref:Uncharacterized protein n=1 Tax=Dibothriocephalus latus TaxID=60516 RepID=A0A3P7LV30_DIBLA|nr:unnamed protein product [Dibothriocephalus latus]
MIFDELCAPRSLGSIDPETGLCSNFGYLLTKTCLMPRDPSIMGSIVSAFKRAQDCPPRDRLLRLRSLFAASTSTLSYGEWKGAYSDTSKVRFFTFEPLLSPCRHPGFACFGHYCRTC